jgi:hemerythrin-like domain-containing protein
MLWRKSQTSLPSNVNTGKCFMLAHSISPLIRDIHRFEQRTLFPLMKSRPYPPGELAATVERLKVEHFTDECYADELTEKLLHLGCGRHDVNMEATGYMLRGFFETMRRQISFEQDYFFGPDRTSDESRTA